jgi:HAD superfamily hydrolase (TIGR01509 family)
MLIYKCRESEAETAKFGVTLMTQRKLRVKGILFDLDGTIVESREAYLHASKVAFASLGNYQFSPCVALEIPKRLEQGMPIQDLVGDNVQSFLKIYLETYYSVTKTMTKPIANVKTTLETLSKKAKLALITMRFVSKAAVIEELHHFGLDQFFTYVVTALDTHKPKPSPEAMMKTVKALDVNICDCVIVGDSVTDIRAGKTAGAMTVAVLSGLFSKEELSKEEPDLILKDVTELPIIIDFCV